MDLVVYLRSLWACEAVWGAWDAWNAASPSEGGREAAGHDGDGQLAAAWSAVRTTVVTDTCWEAAFEAGESGEVKADAHERCASAVREVIPWAALRLNARV